MNTPQSAVGAPLVRVDGHAKVTGAALYAGDQHSDGMLHAVLVTSTIASGRVVAIDDARARTMRGVALVMTPANAPKLPKEGKAAFDPPAGRALSLLQDDAVHYNGQPIALVVADSLECARAAAQSIRVRYEPGTSKLDFAAARANAYAPKQVHDKPPDSSEGDVEAASHEAAVRVEATYTTPMEHHNPMEPHATVAAWKGDLLTLWDATQFVTGVKKTVAKTMGLLVDDVRVISPFVGGGFGCKGSAWSHVVLCAMAARRLRKPVRLVVERTQMWGPVGGRPMTEQRVMLAASNDGRLIATRHAVVSHTSTFEDFVEPSALQTRMLYASRTRATSHRLVALHVGTPTFQRAPGEASGTFALESAMDELAAELGIDPVALRVRNHADRSPEGDLPWSSKSLLACYREGARRFGWSLRQPRPRMQREGNMWVGRGMATATYPTNRSKASARVAIGTDGIATVQSGTQELGTGAYTVMTQVAADALGFPIERVRFELGDTVLPEAPVSGGSQSTASVSPAVQAAARQARDQLIDLAAADAASPLHGLDRAQIRIVEGWLACTKDYARRERVETLLRRAGRPVIADATTAPGEEKKQFAMHAFGAVFVEARVDADLGLIRIPRVVGVYGVGRRLNEKTAHSQLMGGIVMGIGMALFEQSLLDVRSGRFANANLAEYHVPVNADIGQIEVTFVDETDPHVNPLGVKGIGEIGITGVTAAIANAVYNATGARVRDLPITLDKALPA